MQKNGVTDGIKWWEKEKKDWRWMDNVKVGLKEIQETDLQRNGI